MPSHTAEPNKERAKQIILEIVKQSPGDEVESKTKLFKAFYFAHLFYAAEHADFLSDWPIVKMPLGPGIDRVNELISDLVADKTLVVVENSRVGPYQATKYRATRSSTTESLSPEAKEAIRKAVEFCTGYTAAQLSEITHERSRSWNEEMEFGRELSIYMDLLSDEEYERQKQRHQTLSRGLEAAWRE